VQLWTMNGGNHNSAVGAGSMLVNSSGSNNTAFGTSTLYNSTYGEVTILLWV
jgi:hypothetical protein